MRRGGQRTQERHDADHRLGRGLKRWAEAGQATMDLEAYVRARTPEPTGGTAATAEVGGSAALKHSRRWLRLAAGFASAAALALALTATFPSWAGAASNWPLVGPVLTELILKDAGLKWAYDNGLIQGTLAEATEGAVTVRILGVVADSRRTTVIYQIAGLPTRAVAAKVMSDRPSEDRLRYPAMSLSVVDGPNAGAWFNAPVETPVGLVGTISTVPLAAESARLLISVRLRDRTLDLPIQASRSAADKVSREVTVNQSQEIDGVKFTVESVIYTPAETVVRYREENTPFMFGPRRFNPETEMVYVESEGRRYSMSGGNDASFNGVHMVAFPPVKSPITFIIPVAMKGVAADMVWPLRPGATQQAGAVAIKLTKWAHTGDRTSFEWEYPESDNVVGFGTFEALDTAGNAYPLGLRGSGEGNNPHGDGTMVRDFDAELPADLTPVAVRARVIGYKVTGPWRFELPQ